MSMCRLQNVGPFAQASLHWDIFDTTQTEQVPEVKRPVMDFSTILP